MREPLDHKRPAGNEIMGDLITSFIRRRQPILQSAALLHRRSKDHPYLEQPFSCSAGPGQTIYVLVIPEFESNPGFYYKPAKNRMIRCNGKKISTKDACINLAELPFIRLRNKLSLEGAGFRELAEPAGDRHCRSSRS